MKLSELKIGDMFEVYCELDQKLLQKCVYVGIKIVPQSKINASKQVHSFISYDSVIQSFYADADQEVTKTTFEYKKAQFEAKWACNIYMQHLHITECNGVVIAHTSPANKLKYKIDNFNVRDFDIHQNLDNIKINWEFLN